MGSRYSKEDLLTVYAQQRDAGLIDANLPSHFAGPWDVNGGTNGSFGRQDSRDPGPDVCWTLHPDSVPLALAEMDDTERQVCTLRFFTRHGLIE